MKEHRSFSPIEFYRYISEPIPKSDLDIWFKANDIVWEKSELFFYFIKTLHLLIYNTYLGADITYKQEDIANHFNWCWGEVLSDLDREGIIFNKEGAHYDYFWNFFMESFYGENYDYTKIKVDNFFGTLFKIDNRKTKSDLDIYTDLYKTLDNNLVQ
jgi:hypothetical protein